MKVLIVIVCLSAAAQHWYLGRTLRLENFASSTRPSTLDVVPVLLSGAAGSPGRRIGEEDPAQVKSFLARGGLVPSARLDIREVAGDGSARLVWVVDPGIMWLWHALSRLGWRLDLASMAHAQVCADFVAFGLAIALGWRLAGAYGGALVGLLYAWSLAVESGVTVVSYYPWSIVGSLLAGHLLLSAVVTRAWAAWWLGYAALGAALVWLRGMWLPVSMLLVMLPAAVLRSRRSLIVGLVGLAMILASFGATAARVKAAGVGDGTLSSRSQLWHTLYIGLGWYGNFGPIQWRDGYAYEVAASMRVPVTNHRRYEAHVRGLFLEAIGRAPLTYLATLGRRAVDYLRAGWYGWSPWLVEACLIAGVGAVVTVLLFGDHATRRRYVGPVALYAGSVAVWSVLVPPQESYTLETLGLVYPVMGAGVVSALSLAASRAARVGGALADAARWSARPPWIGRARFLLLGAGAVTLAILGAVEGWRSRDVAPPRAQAVAFRRADSGAPPGASETFPAVRAEYLLRSQPLQKSRGVDTLVVRDAPAVRAGAASIGVLDVARDRWAFSSLLDGANLMLDLTRLDDGDWFRLLVAGANAGPLTTRLEVRPAAVVQRRRALPSWLAYVSGSLMVGVLAVLAKRAPDRR